MAGGVKLILTDLSLKAREDAPVKEPNLKKCFENIYQVNGPIDIVFSNQILGSLKWK